MSDNFNQLTPAEVERLAWLSEECGEVIQAIGKILRHGYESTHPSTPQGPTNRQTLMRELGDVKAIINLMQREDDISLGAVAQAASRKTSCLMLYAHHQGTYSE